MQKKPKTTKLIRDLNKKFGAGTWRTRILHDERQIERKVNGQWQFWGWDDSFNADRIRQDYLDGPSAYHSVEVIDEYGY
jgi:hypothetical protein